MPLSTYNSKYAQISPNPRNLAAGAMRQKVAVGKADPSISFSKPMMQRLFLLMKNIRIQ